MIKNIIFLSIIALFLNSCSSSSSPIADQEDYNQYLQPTHLEAAQSKLLKEIDFWNKKLATSPNDYVFQTKLAGLYAAQYKLTGNVELLQQSDTMLQSLNTRIGGQVGVLHALSSNAMTQHAFRIAEKYAKEAYDVKENKHTSSLLRADVALERGQMDEAYAMMNDLMDKNEFDYLIRNVKVKDHEGNLTAAIKNMELALKKAKASGKSNLINWSLSNLGDMYGHDGRIQKSYDTYLAALAENPADLHSLKGIAWVAFAHDKNTEEAKRILNFLKSIHAVPDYNLLLAEIAYFENDAATAKKYEQDFLAEASEAKYGNMYKSYICLLQVDNKNTKEALAIAKEEVEERPSAGSYDLLAWTSYHEGQTEKAVDIVEKFVNDQTEEPMTLFHRGIILKGAGKTEAAKKYLGEALEAEYELGPLITQEIKQALAKM